LTMQQGIGAVGKDLELAASVRDGMMLDIHYIFKLAQNYGWLFFNRGDPIMLITGDWNFTPYSMQFQEIQKQGFHSAFDTAGWGLGFSFPTRLPLVRIDHGFSNDAQPINAEYVRLGDADHYGLLVEWAY
jgi:endonuclease/exonuclease/phosphatase family metal-dependent hydrolase